MKRAVGVEIILLGSLFLSHPALAQQDPVDAYQPCRQATQHLAVPEQINLAVPGEVPPEPHHKFTFMFTENGVDAYAVRTGEVWSAVLVFQDEKVRREQLKSYISSDTISWQYFEPHLGRQNWKPIANLKYALLEFNWMKNGTEWQPLLVHVQLYAPLSCESLTTFRGTLPSSMVGSFLNISPPELSHDTLAYRAAMELRKTQDQSQLAR
jgi:hypothetical protein